MSFKRDIYLNKVNRNFNIKVRLYFNDNSFNREIDSTPRFYLEPVKLNAVERVAFTKSGAKEKEYIKIARGFYGGKNELVLNDEQMEYIFSKIKTSFPYGYEEGNEASKNKYLLDFKYNASYQGHLRQYWENNTDKIKDPIQKITGATAPYSYIEIDNVDEIVKYKYAEGDVPALESSDTSWADYIADIGYGDTQPLCSPLDLEINVASYDGKNVYFYENVEYPVFSVKKGYTYTFTMAEPWAGEHPLQFSATYDGEHELGIEYLEGVRKFGWGTQGSVGSKVSIDITADTPSVLHFYCPNHSQMGGFLIVNESCTIAEPLIVPTATATLTRTPTAEPTRTPTSTPTETPTRTVTSTATSSPTSTATYTPTPYPTATSTATNTSTPTPIATATPTSTDTSTPTKTQSQTGTGY